MKRVISLTLMLVAALTIYAQINTNIWGLTVGKSTKQQVKNVLRNKGYSVEVLYDGTIAIAPKSGVYFGGQLWERTYFAFYKNTLSQVAFQTDNESSFNNVYSVFYVLSNKLKEKYGRYYKFSEEDKYFYFDDGNNTVSISIYNSDVSSSIIYVSLSYYNNILDSKRTQSETDEL